MDLEQKLVDAHRKVFPKSACVISNGTLDPESIFVRVFLGKRKEEMPNHISANDPLNVRLFITPATDGKYTVEPNASVTGLHPSVKYMAYDSVKLRTRKFTGTEEKVVDNFAKLLERVRDEVVSLHQSDRFKVKLNYDILEKL